MSKRIEEIMKNYSQRDYEALTSIYYYRCLSMDQLYHLHYSKSIKGTKEVSVEYLKKKLAAMKRDGLIEPSDRLTLSLPTLFSLTKDGVTVVKESQQFETNAYDENRRLVKRGYLTSSEVCVSTRFMSHQYHLNQFAIETADILDKLKVPYEYRDEKHLDSTATIRPDAIFKTSKFDIFLEMDMGTESLANLEEKWDHYDRFLGSSSYDPNKKIIILFICDERKLTQNRMNLIKHSITQHFFHNISNRLEMYVGPQRNLKAVIRAKIVPEYFDTDVSIIHDLKSNLIRHNFKIAGSEQLADKFNNKKYTFYAYNEGKNLQFMVQEFLGEPLSVMKKAADFNFDSQEFAKSFTQKIPLLIIGTSEQAIMNNNKLFSIPSENIYYSTLDRLATKPLNEALFKILNDQIVHFDFNFKNLVAEK